MKIAFIGGGNMGEAMLSAILEKKLGSIQEVVVSDTDESRRRYIKDKYGVGVTDDNWLAVSRAAVIVLAVKPQNVDDVINTISDHLNAVQLVISIIAGVSTETLSQGLKHSCVVRAMPNTPAQIGEGMTVWTATTAVTGQHKEAAGAILGAMGKEIYVDDEKYIDMATAISGSGPAYFFLFVEALVEAGGNIGLPRDVTGELVLQTMLGAGHLIRESGKEPAELRRMVTSPGGTTAEAIAEFERGEFSGLVKQAVSAAYRRARELGGKRQ